MTDDFHTAHSTTSSTDHYQSLANDVALATTAIKTTGSYWLQQKNRAAKNIHGQATGVYVYSSSFLFL